MTKSKKGFQVLINISLTLLASLLFFFANPNFVFQNGIGIFAWFYFIPVLFVVKKSNLKSLIFYGFLYGFTSYSLFAYWLCNSYILAYVGIIIFYGIMYSLVFAGLKYCQKIYAKDYWILQGLLICGAEYIKTLGFLGFGYGVTAYTQWNYKILIQVTNIIGTFGLNFLIIFSSCIVFAFIYKLQLKNHIAIEISDRKSNMERFSANQANAENQSLKLPVIFGSIWIVLIILCIGYGIYSVNKVSDNKEIVVCAIQSDDNPWDNSFESYENSVKVLKKITEEALEINPEIQMVIWPETAVVPAIVYNYEKGEPKRKKLVNDLLDYLDSKSIQFVIGNGHKIRNEKAITEVYNSALVFDGGENVIPPRPYIYSKNKLVPFTEYFPLKKHLPDIYTFLVSKGNVLWTPGKTIEIFNCGELKYSTPICFEDTFTKVCRKMALKGSKCFVNISNDSWSNSKACQNQHLAMGIFRSVENGVPGVKCSTNGVTCLINSKGQIENQIESFKSGYLIGKVEIQNSKNTIYTRIGDIAGILEIVFFILLLIIRIIIVKIEEHSNSRK